MPINTKAGETSPQDYTAGASPASMNPDNATTTAYPAGTSQSTINTQVASQQGATATTTRPGERNTPLESTNREKMLASGELKADTNPQLAQEKINLFTYGVENPTFGPTISSDATRTDLAKKTDEVNKGLASTQQAMTQLPTPDYKLYSDYTQEYEKARAAGKDIYESTVQSIQKDFEIRQQVQADENRVNAGFQAKTLARMNALGTGASGLSFLQQVDVQNQREMNKLLIQKGQVLIQAAEAAQAKDIELLGKLVAESHNITDQYNKVQSQRLADSIMTNDQRMEQNKFGWLSEDRAMGKIADAITAKIDQTKNAGTIAQWEKDAGVTPGYFSDLAKVSKIAEEAKTTADNLKFQTDLADLLLKTPTGKTIQIGDKTYTGNLDPKDNTWHGTSSDDAGNVVGLVYDPKDKSWTTTQLGKIGAAKDGDKIINVNGLPYIVNPNTPGTAIPVELTGGFINPEIQPGVDGWVKSIGNISQGFGDTVTNSKGHTGLDITGVWKSEISAQIGGEVVAVDVVGAGAYGKNIVIHNNDTGLSYRYAHLDSVGVAAGDQITADQMIGRLGNTGNVETTHGGTTKPEKVSDAERAQGLGAHLHFEVFKPNSQNFPNPKKDISEPGVKAQYDDYLTAMRTALTLVGSDTAAPSYQNLIGSLQKGDVEVSKDILTRAAIANLPKGTQTGLLSFSGIQKNLDNIKTALNEYVNKKGDTSLLSGTYQLGLKSLGQTSDPELIKLKTKIDLNLGQYLQAVSGKQVSEQERAAYKSIFPSIVNENELNAAQIDAIQETLNETYRSSISAGIGPTVYHRIFEAAPVFTGT